jgi:hypothetical protein
LPPTIGIADRGRDGTGHARRVAEGWPAPRGQAGRPPRSGPAAAQRRPRPQARRPAAFPPARSPPLCRGGGGRADQARYEALGGAGVAIAPDCNAVYLDVVHPFVQELDDSTELVRITSATNTSRSTPARRFRSAPAQKSSTSPSAPMTYSSTAAASRPASAQVRSNSSQSAPPPQEHDPARCVNAGAHRIRNHAPLARRCRGIRKLGSRAIREPSFRVRAAGITTTLASPFQSSRPQRPARCP